MIRLIAAGVFVFQILGLVTAVGASETTLIQVEVDRVKHEGRLEVRSDSQCWLMDRAGGLIELPFAKMTNIRQLSPRFQALTSTMLRTQLRREFGRSLEVGSTRHYLVVAPDGKADAYAELFEEIYRSMYMHFSVRGLKIQEPEFPLVAIVFPDHASFATNAKRDDVDPRPGLMGYYSPTSNRVLLFEGQPSRESTGNAAPHELPLQSGHTRSQLDDVLFKPNGNWFGAIEGNLRDTMIHEATHQVAFNVGLHSRIGQNPRWIVEGLATVFEADGIRDSSSSSSVKQRINRDRFVWFQNYAKERHQSGALEKCIRSDSAFKTQTLDAYAFSWALSFFLIETRPRQYASLLRQLGSREPLSDLSEEERLLMFEKTIGSNLKLLEAEMLRFFDRIS